MGPNRLPTEPNQDKAHLDPLEQLSNALAIPGTMVEFQNSKPGIIHLNPPRLHTPSPLHALHPISVPQSRPFSDRSLKPIARQRVLGDTDERDLRAVGLNLVLKILLFQVVLLTYAATAPPPSLYPSPPLCFESLLFSRRLEAEPPPSLTINPLIGDEGLSPRIIRKATSRKNRGRNGGTENGNVYTWPGYKRGGRADRLRSGVVCPTIGTTPGVLDEIERASRF